jgi:hypothetical protein
VTATIANVTQILKTLYSDFVPMVGIGRNVAWGLIPKHTDFTGRYKSLPLQYGSMVASHTFGSAQTYANSGSFAEFLLTRSQDFLTPQINAELWEAADSSGAQVAYAKRVVDTAMKRLAHRLNRNLHRNYGGAVAQITSGGNTQTITVTEPADLYAISVDDYLVSSNTDGTSGSVDLNPTRVSAIDRTAGTITTDAAGSWDTAAGGFSNSDFLFPAGDFGVAGYGFGSWIPSSAPGATSFFGQDRSLDTVRLGGLRITATAADSTLENLLIRAAAECDAQGGEPDTFITNTLHIAQFMQELGNKVRITTVPAMTANGPSGKIGFSAIMLMTPYGEIRIVGDRDCPRHVGWMLTMDTWGFYGLKAAPRIFDYGGGDWLRMGSEDSLEMRCGWRGQFGCNAPGHNARVIMTALTNP